MELKSIEISDNVKTSKFKNFLEWCPWCPLGWGEEKELTVTLKPTPFNLHILTEENSQFSYCFLFRPLLLHLKSDTFDCFFRIL